jgi:ThiF family
MPPLQISLSPDLRRLRDEGFNIEVRATYLHVHDVPYVTSAGDVACGTIVSELTTNGVSTVAPSDHTVCFVGGIPHDIHGEPLSKIINNPNAITLAEGLVADCQFSSKPASGAYTDYYEKVVSYINMVSGPAQAIDAHATPRTFPVAAVSVGESVFRYHDAASSRARISAVTEKLAIPSVAIVGLGGTGAYILDQVAKTPVAEIHLHDPDRLYAHNAFRSPGAASIEQLTQSPLKVDYYKRIYDMVRYGIGAHAERIDENTIAQLQSMSFVFLAIDSGPCRKFISERLLEYGVPFIDCGIGVYRTGESLAGIVRTTTCTPEGHELHRLPVVDDEDDEYNNIQLADLNALNAIYAVIKWKKLFGFYTDLEHEHHSAYTIDGNHLSNEDSRE